MRASQTRRARRAPATPARWPGARQRGGRRLPRPRCRNRATRANRSISWRLRSSGRRPRRRSARSARPSSPHSRGAVSWTIGAMMISRSRCGLCQSSRNSLRMSARIAAPHRCASLTADRAQHRAAQTRRAPPCGARITSLSARPFNTTPRSATRKYFAGTIVRHVLQRHRHARNGKDESREHEHGQERQQHRGLQRDLLRVGHRSRPAARCRAPVTRNTRHHHEEREPVAAHRQAEHGHRGEDDQKRRRLRQHEIGQRLAHDERQRRNRAPCESARSSRFPSRGRWTARWRPRRRSSRCRRSGRAPGTACCAAPGCTRPAKRRRPAAPAPPRPGRADTSMSTPLT